MGISSNQIETWSHVGSVTCSTKTYDSVKACIDSHKFPDGVKYTPYLQGSYGNTTNIRGESDVDIVIELYSCFQPDISKLQETDKQIFHKKYPNSTLTLADFKREVLDCFRKHYEPEKIVEGNKAVKIQGYSGRLDADIIIAIQYRFFWKVNENGSDDFVEGIAFQKRDGSWVYSYPKAHLNNGVSKMALTNNQFKSLVRVYKNIRGQLDNDFIAADKYYSSYMIESLIYNVPNNLFKNSLSDTFNNSLNWLNKDADFISFNCQHGYFKLFGTSEGQCSVDSAKAFISSVKELNDNWSQ